MKDSRVGTYGVVGSVLALGLKVASLAAVPVPAAPAALLLGHSLSRWVSLPLLFFSEYIQDEEDAKKGMYNWFAQSQTLLTPARLALATGGTALAALVLSPSPRLAGAALALCAAVAAAAWRYGNRIIGGVVGDFLGATIAVTEVLLYLLLTVDWQRASEPATLNTLGVLVAVSVLPMVYARRIVDYNTSC